MKKTLIFAVLLFSLGTVFGQTIHQNDILSFCDANMGKKIGKGLCYELVQGAFQQYSPVYDMGAIKSNRDRYGKKVKTPMPGDVVLQEGNGINHVGIVYKIEGDSIFIVEQNTEGNLKKSKVEVNLLDYDQLKKFYGKVEVSFYRPE